MGRIVVCDDEAAVRFALGEVLEDRGHVVIGCAGGAEALGRLDEADLLITDLSMPEMDGLTLLAEARARRADLPVIVVTARGSERVAVRAMKSGAHDYLVKPFDNDELALAVERGIEAASLRRSDRQRAVERASGRAVVGDSPAMRRLFDVVARVAGKDVPVLVRGETGTGKELVATMLHVLGGRARGPLVRFNCAAIPEDLAEAELFGHVKGAFTGAVDARPGFFRRADGGTLVLDEIGELPLAIQPKLLRALQDGEVQPVGSGRVEKVDVRVVACTHRDLSEDAKSGRFRADLYYRLAVIELAVPTLAERPEDIPALARAFAARHGERFGLGQVRLSDAAVAELARRSYPGNVRELENTVARMVALSDGGELDVAAVGELAAPAAASGPATFRERVDAFERGLIEAALRDAAGNRSLAARTLGLSRVTLLDRMKRLGVG